MSTTLFLPMSRPLPDPDVALLVPAVRRRMGAISTRSGVAIALAWDSLDTYDEADIASFAAKAAPIVDAAERAAITVARSFYSTVAGMRPVSVPRSAAIGQVTWAPREGFTAYWHSLGEGNEWTNAVATGRSAAQGALADDITSTFRSTADFVIHEADLPVLKWTRWPSPDACDWCLDVAQRGPWPTAEAADFGHERCVVGSTLVASAEPPRGLSRRWHRGQFVVLRTAAGNHLTVTPNHPILTTRGWVAAEALSEGDDLFYCPDVKRASLVVPHEYQVPTCVEDLFRAASMSGSVRMPLTAEDFHGDIVEGDVEVVAANRSLVRQREASFRQHPRELLLSGRLRHVAERPRLCGLHQAFLAHGLASAGSMSGRGYAGSLLDRHATHPKGGRGAAATNRLAFLDEVAAYGGSRHTHRPSDRILRLAPPVLLGNLGAEGYATPGDDHSLPVQGPVYGAPADARGGHDLIHGLAGAVTTDRLIELSRFEGSAHVFNLATEAGWYSANGIVVHNCKCVPVPSFVL